MDAEDEAPAFPTLSFARKYFGVCCEALDPAERSRLRAEVMQEIETHSMAPFYERLCADLKTPVDATLLTKLQAANAEQKAKLDAALKEAEETAGESEIRQALLAIANHYSRIGAQEEALKAYRVTLEKTIGVGQKLDIVFTTLRWGFLADDLAAVAKGLAQADEIVATASDWERKNRLKVYRGLYLMIKRDFAGAAALFLETITTFGALEVFSDSEYIQYTVLMSMISLPRPELKKKVVDAPEVAGGMERHPIISKFLSGLYGCNYGQFFSALVDVLDRLRTDPYLHAHLSFYGREMRILAYTQFLHSYRSVQLTSMAAAFGVSPEFIDKELARFIAAGRLLCRIDKVDGVVVAMRADSKTQLYHQTLKMSDPLLNRVHKLSRVVGV